MSKRKTRLEARTHSLVEETRSEERQDSADLKDFQNSSSDQQASAIYSRSLSACLEAVMVVVDLEETYRQKVRTLL